MKRIYSKEMPGVMRHRGMISIPVDIREEPAPVDSIDPGEPSPVQPGGYSCRRIQVGDTGQDLTCPDTCLGLRREAERTAITFAYQDQLAAGCPIESLGIRVDCKAENRADFAQTLSVLSITYADQPNAMVTVRDYNNANHEITFAEYQVLCQELAAHVTALRQAKWAAVDALKDMEA